MQDLKWATIKIVRHSARLKIKKITDLGSSANKRYLGQTDFHFAISEKVRDGRSSARCC